MSDFNRQVIHSLHWWTDTLFSLTCSRSAAFEFESGQFVRIRSAKYNQRLSGRYGIVSPSDCNELEFLCTRTPTEGHKRGLEHLVPDDEVLVDVHASGTLTLDALLPGHTLWLIASGAGIAPFMSVIRDPDVYRRFERVVLVHTCRRVRELAYRDDIMTVLPTLPDIGDFVRRQLIYYPTVTREPFPNSGRVTALIRSGALFTRLRLDPFSSSCDRIMMCGSPAMLRDAGELLDSKGFVYGHTLKAGHFVMSDASGDEPLLSHFSAVKPSSCQKECM